MKKRTPPAKRPGNNWPIPLFDATAQPPDDRVDDADEGSDPRVVMEAVLMGFAQITDPVEAEVLGSMFLGAIGFLGADVAAVAASELVAVIEAVGDPRAAGMLAVLAALGEGRIGEAAAAGLDRLRACGVAAPEWMAALSAPVTARDCVELCEDGETLVLAARFDRAGAAHAVMILLDPQDCGEAAEIMLLDSSDLTEALAELRRNAKRDKVRLTTTAIDPAEFRWRVEAAMDARDHHDRDDQDDPDDITGQAGSSSAQVQARSRPASPRTSVTRSRWRASHTANSTSLPRRVSGSPDCDSKRLAKRPGAATDAAPRGASCPRRCRRGCGSRSVTSTVAQRALRPNTNADVMMVIASLRVDAVDAEPRCYSLGSGRGGVRPGGVGGVRSVRVAPDWPLL